MHTEEWKLTGLLQLVSIIYAGKKISKMAIAEFNRLKNISSRTEVKTKDIRCKYRWVPNI